MIYDNIYSYIPINYKEYIYCSKRNNEKAFTTT